MADAEIEIKATADAAEAQQQLERTAAAIERVAVAVQDAAERLRTFDLSPLSEALASFESSAARTKSLSGAVSGWRDEVEGAKASAEATVDAIGDLSLRLEDVAQGLRDGSMSSEQAIAATQKIRDEYKALSTESQEFRQAVRELYGDLQSASAVAAAAAEKEGQAAEKSLQKIEQASERKRRARELEAQSAEALREKLEALRSEEEAARGSGNMPAAADAAQQAAAVEQALQRRSAAEQRAADREEQMASRRQTRLSLEGKSYVELARHLKALVAAREEAAQAGDGEAYDQLTAQIKGTRAAVEDLTTRTNIARTAMLGKAQAGMMVADQMGQLANGFRDGSVSAAGFATTIMSVGMAIKAGLGPIGWAMAAVQALQMALDHFVGSKITEANQKAIAESEQAMQQLKQLRQEQQQLLRDLSQEELDRDNDRLRIWQENIQKRADEERSVYKLAHEQALTSIKERVDSSQQESALLREQILLLEQQGRISKAEADEKIASIEEEEAARERAARRARAQSQLDLAERDKEIAQRQAEELEEAFTSRFRKLEPLLSMKLPDMADVKRIQYELNNARSSSQERKWEQKDAALTEEVEFITSQLKKAGVVYAGGWEGAVRIANSLQDEYREQQKILETSRARAEEADRALTNARRNSELGEESNKREEELSELKRKRIQETREQEKIAELTRQIYQNTQLSGEYSRADMRTLAERMRTDRELLRQRLLELQSARGAAEASGESPKVMQSLNEKIRETRDQMAGLEQSAREAAIEVLRSLNKDKEGASVDLVAMLRRDQNKVDRAAEKIARQADAAARYLDAAATARRAGDQDAEERYYAAYERRIAGMQKLGASVDRMTVTGDMGTAEVQRLLGNLRIQEQVQMRRNRAGLRLADSEERQAQRAQRDAAASRVQAPARPGGAEAAPAPAAQEEQYRAEVAQLRQAAELLREQNRQMGGFVTQCTKALGDMAASCRAMADQLASATGQIAAVQQQMRNVNASVRATARGAV